MTTSTVSPGSNPFRRSFTLPAQSPHSAHDRGTDPSEEPDEILFEHPKVDVFSFSIPGKLASPTASPRTPQFGGTLQWAPPNKKIEFLDRPLRLRRPKTGAAFLQGGTKAKELFRLTLMPNTEMWCVDGQSKFATHTLQTVYRIDLPFGDPGDEKNVEDFKEALAKIIRYEPTDVPCPFNRKSTAPAQVQDDTTSPKRKPKRALIGTFQDLSKPVSGPNHSRRNSDWTARPSYLRTTSSNDELDEDDPINAEVEDEDEDEEEEEEEEKEKEKEKDQDLDTKHDIHTEPTTLIEETPDSISSEDPDGIVPSPDPRETSHAQAQPASGATLVDQEQAALHERQISSDASESSESDASPQADDSSLAEPSSPASDDDVDADPHDFERQQETAKLVHPPSPPTLNPVPADKSVTSGASSKEQEDSDDDDSGTSSPQLQPTEPSQEREAPSPVQSPSLPSATIEDPIRESPSQPGQPEEKVVEEEEEEKEEETPDASTPDPSPIRITSSEPAASEDSPSLRLRSTAANATPPDATAPASNSSTAVPHSPSETPSRRPASDPNTYILSKLIDLLTSPPSKFFGALLDLLRLISDRTFGGVVASVGNGVVGTLRLPKTPGRWVDSEEGSDADDDAAAEDDNDNDDAAAEPDSEDEWDLDGGTDDYGIPLGNNPVVRTTSRQKTA